MNELSVMFANCTLYVCTFNIAGIAEDFPKEKVPQRKRTFRQGGVAE
jgi:hypothetical protein